MGSLKGFGQRALHLIDIENLAGGPFSSERLESLAAELAAAVAARGTQVTVISRPGSLSRTLSESAHYVLHLATPPNRVAGTHLKRAA